MTFVPFTDDDGNPLYDDDGNLLGYEIDDVTLCVHVVDEPVVGLTIGDEEC